MKSNHLVVLLVFCSALMLDGCSGKDTSTTSNPVEPVSSVPAVPANTAAISGVKTLTVRWDAAKGANAYNLYYSTSPGVTPSTGTKVANVSSPYTFTGLASDTSYYVVVTSVNGNSESIASSRVSGIPHRTMVVFGSPDADYGSDITSDKDGNLYTVGDTSGDFDGHTRIGYRDIFLIKYGADGTKLWSRQIGAVNAYSNVAGVATDTAGFIYVTGTTGGGFDNNIKIGNTDLFLVKYDNGGNKLWSRQLGATGATIDTPSVAVDKTGHIFVSGSTTASLADQMIAGLKDLFLAKYDSGGNMLWLQTRGTTNQYSAATALDIDDSGKVVLGGSSCGGFEGATATGTCDLLLLGFDSNGNKLWTRMVGATGAYTSVSSLSLDSEGNSYVTGSTGGNYDGITKTAWGDNMFLSKFDKNGDRQWSKLLSGGFYAYGNAVTVDDSGNAYVVGTTGNPIDGNSAISGKDIFVVKYDTDGNKKWSKQLGVSYSATLGGGIAVDGIGGKNVYVVGSANGDIFTHVASSSYYDFNFFLAGLDGESGDY